MSLSFSMKNHAGFYRNSLGNWKWNVCTWCDPLQTAFMQLLPSDGL